MFLDFRVALVLPKTVGPTGPRVVLIRSNQYDPNKFFITEFLTVTLIIQQVCNK